VPERSKGVDSSSTVFALVGSNPTADNMYSVSRSPVVVRCLAACLPLDWFIHFLYLPPPFIYSPTLSTASLDLQPPMTHGKNGFILYSLHFQLRRHLVPTPHSFLAPWTIRQTCTHEKPGYGAYLLLRTRSASSSRVLLDQPRTHESSLGCTSFAPRSQRRLI
jgi:hypothetical protein